MPEPARKTAMISSTSLDLPEHRQQAMDACLRQDTFPLAMEHLPARDADAIRVSLEMERYEDAYVVFQDHLSNATLYRLSAYRQRAEWLERLFPDGVDTLPRRRQHDDTARELLDQVWTHAERGPYPLLHVDTLNVLAQLECDQGYREAAATEAYKQDWCDGPPYAYHFGRSNARRYLPGTRRAGTADAALRCLQICADAGSRA